jgi:hypothetical protein
MNYQQALRIKRDDDARITPKYYAGRMVPCRDVMCVSWAKCRDCGRVYSRSMKKG